MANTLAVPLQVKNDSSDTAPPIPHHALSLFSELARGIPDNRRRRHVIIGYPRPLDYRRKWVLSERTGLISLSSPSRGSMVSTKPDQFQVCGSLTAHTAYVKRGEHSGGALTRRDLHVQGRKDPTNGRIMKSHGPYAFWGKVLGRALWPWFHQDSNLRDGSWKRRFEGGRGA